MAERFGEYELIKKIATGGMAEIYLARIGGLEGFSRRVVVKRMLPQLAVRDDFVQMFLDEARLAANLVHPNIVQVFNLGQVDGAYFMAMELIDGPHLGALFAHSLRQRRPLPLELCVYVIARAADGLHYAHEQRDQGTGQPLNIVHRDISPQNILVSRHGDVKVTDFGVAKAETQQSKTRTGIIKGKVSYMSPEQCLGEPVDRRTDVFALGVVLYELLTRRRLYREKSDLLIMQRITTEDAKSPSNLNPAIDRELDDIAVKALGKVRDGRFRSAADLSEALDVWLATQGHADCRSQLQRWMEAHADGLGIGGGAGGDDVAGHTPAWEKSGARDISVDDSEVEGTASTPALDGDKQALFELHRRVAVDEHDVSTSRIKSLEATESEEDRDVVASDGGSFPNNTQLILAPPPSLDDPPTLREPALLDEPPQRREMPMAAIVGATFAVALAGVAGAVFALQGDEVAPDDIEVVEERRAAEAGGALVEPAPQGAAEPAPPPADDDPAASDAPPPPPAAPVVVEKAAVAAEPIALTVETVPAGAIVMVDGHPGGKAPIVVELPGGEERDVDVQAVFSDQPPVTKRAHVVPGEKNELVILAKVRMGVTSDPTGAALYLGDANVGVTPRDDLLVMPGEKVVVTLSRSGYKRHSQEVVPEPGQPVRLEVALEKLKSASPSPPSAAEQQAFGALRVSSKPWGLVWLDGKRLGASPVTVERVKAGAHKVKIQSKDEGFSKTIDVVVKKNVETHVGFVFEKKGDAWELVRLVQQ